MGPRLSSVVLSALMLLPPAAAAQPIAPDVFKAVLPESGLGTRNISTEEMRAAITDGRTLVLDTRPHAEWAVSHIPGARNVAPKPGMALAAYTSDVAEIVRLTGGDRSRPLVLYCNGPFCGKSKRVAEDLLEAGYADVRRYQLGAPVWRALGHPMVTEPEALKYVRGADRTAVWVDAREPAEARGARLPGAVAIPRGGLSGKDEGVLLAAKNDGRLPMSDHNTRIVVFGSSAEQARAVAEAIAAEAFHNVSYVEGGAEVVRAALR